MKFWLLSDTHWPTRGMYDLRWYIRQFSDVDYLFHMWDFDVWSTYKFFKDYFWDKLIAVYGNCDDRKIRNEIPEERLLEINWIKILVFHSHSIYPRWDETRLLEKALMENVNIVFYGHTHIKKVHYFDLLNNEFKKVNIHGEYFSFSKEELDYKIYFINPGSLLNWDFLFFNISLKSC